MQIKTDVKKQPGSGIKVRTSVKAGRLVANHSRRACAVTS